MRLKLGIYFRQQESQSLRACSDRRVRRSDRRSPCFKGNRFRLEPFWVISLVKSKIGKDLLVVCSAVHIRQDQLIYEDSPYRGENYGGAPMAGLAISTIYALVVHLGI